MPAFVFCSGYFSKSVRARGKESTVKMLLCYMLFNTAMMLFAHFYLGRGFKFLTPYYSYWYIISLICWRVMIGSVEKIKSIIPISIVITLLMGYCGEFSNVLSVRRTVAFFPFFAMGFFWSKEKAEAFIVGRTVKTYIAGGGVF